MTNHTGHRTYKVNRAKLRETNSEFCALCGQRIDKSYPAYHALSFEADHIVPVSQGGGHELSNLRAVHRQCNIQRSNKKHAAVEDKRRCREW